MKNFEQLVDKKLEIGVYQIRLIFLTLILQLLPGCFSFATYIAAPLMSMDWNLSILQVSTILGTGALSVTGGSLILGYLGDSLGRQLIVKIICLFTLAGIVSLYFINTYELTLVVFIMFGFYNSCCYNALFTYIGEMLPQHHRGKLLTFVSGFGSFGRLLGLSISYLVINPYQVGFWKIPFFIYGIMLTFSFIPMLFWMKASLFQLHRKGDFGQLYLTFKEIQEINHSKKELENSEIRITQIDIEDLQKAEVKKISIKNTLSQLFSAENRVKTVCLLSVRGLLSIVFGCEYIIAPYTLGTDSQSIATMFFVVAGEIFGTFICSLIVDKIGRKKTLLGSTFLEMVTFLVQLFLAKDNWKVIMFVRRIFVRSGFTATEIYMVEAYESDVRGTALGLAITLGGFLVSVSAGFSLPLFIMNPNYLFGLWGGVSGLALFLGFFLPSDRKFVKK